MKLPAARPQSLASVWRSGVRSFRPPEGDPLLQEGLGQDLRRRSARGALSTMSGQWVRLVLQVGSTVVLARLISPTEYGLVSMIVALIGIGDALMNLGLSQATIQRTDVTHGQVNVFFWLQAAVGAGLTALVVATAPAIAHFYDDDRIVPLAMALAFTFVLNGLAAQHQAVLARQMRFGVLALIDVLGLLLGAIAAVVLALGGAGAWALVVMTMATPVLRVALSWPASGWSPGRPRRAPGVAPMVRFGLSLTFTNVLDYTAQNIDNVLLGRFYGPATLGLYSRAYNLLLLPIRQVTAPMARVAVPVLSYLKDQPERFRRFFVVALGAVSYVSLPGIALLSALSHEVIAVMLGDQWTEAAPIFQVLALGGIMVSLRSTNGWLFVSTGRTGRQAVWALVNRPVAIAGIIAGIPWGAIGVAWGFVAAHLVMLVPSFVVSARGTPVTMRDIAGAVWRPVVLAALVGASGAAVHRFVTAPSIVVLLLGILAYLGILGLAVLAWPGVARDVRELRESVGSFRRRDQSATEAATG